MGLPKYMKHKNLNSDTNVKQRKLSLSMGHSFLRNLLDRRVDFHPSSSQSTSYATPGTVKPLKQGNKHHHTSDEKKTKNQNYIQSTSAQESPLAAQFRGEDLIVARRDDHVFQDYKWLTTHATWQKPLGAGCGLINLGNTCFLNSTLQCLAYTPIFSQYMLEACHKKSWRLEDTDVFTIVQQTIRKMMMSNSRSPTQPSRIVKRLRLLNRNFHYGSQEDAHEFLRCLLDTMHKCELKNAHVKENAPGRRAETTALHAMFGGYLRNQVHCPDCGHNSNTFDAFMDLSLDLSKGTPTIEKALKHFAAIETLDADNKYKCEHCNRRVCAKKQMTIRQPPNVLTIQLKRFSFRSFGSTGFGMSHHHMRHMSKKQMRKMMRHGMMGMGFGGGSGGKLDKFIEYPLRLDITPALSDIAKAEGTVSKYDLHGVLVHLGHSVNSGHYYSYVKAANGQWYCMDDDDVRLVSSKEVLSQKAYMLFYSRRTASGSFVMNGTTASGSFGMKGTNANTKQSNTVQMQQTSTESTNMNPGVNGTFFSQGLVSQDPMGINGEEDIGVVQSAGVTHDTSPLTNTTNLQNDVQTSRLKEVQIKLQRARKAFEMCETRRERKQLKREMKQLKKTFEELQASIRNVSKQQSSAAATSSTAATASTKSSTAATTASHIDTSVQDVFTVVPALLSPKDSLALFDVGIKNAPNNELLLVDVKSLSKKKRKVWRHEIQRRTGLNALTRKEAQDALDRSMGKTILPPMKSVVSTTDPIPSGQTTVSPKSIKTIVNTKNQASDSSIKSLKTETVEDNTLGTPAGELDVQYNTLTPNKQLKQTETQPIGTIEESPDNNNNSMENVSRLFSQSTGMQPRYIDPSMDPLDRKDEIDGLASVAWNPSGTVVSTKSEKQMTNLKNQKDPRALHSQKTDRTNQTSSMSLNPNQTDKISSVSATYNQTIQDTGTEQFNSTLAPSETSLQHKAITLLGATSRGMRLLLTPHESDTESEVDGIETYINTRHNHPNNMTEEEEEEAAYSDESQEEFDRKQKFNEKAYALLESGPEHITVTGKRRRSVKLSASHAANGSEDDEDARTRKSNGYSTDDLNSVRKQSSASVVQKNISALVGSNHSNNNASSVLGALNMGGWDNDEIVPTKSNPTNKSFNQNYSKTTNGSLFNHSHMTDRYDGTKNKSMGTRDEMDEWNAALDKGHVKKVKKRRRDSSGTDSRDTNHENRFQSILDARGTSKPGYRKGDITSLKRSSFKSGHKMSHSNTNSTESKHRIPLFQKLKNGLQKLKPKRFRHATPPNKRH